MADKNDARELAIQLLDTLKDEQCRLNQVDIAESALTAYAAAVTQERDAAQPVIRIALIRQYACGELGYEQVRPALLHDPEGLAELERQEAYRRSIVTVSAEDALRAAAEESQPK